MNKQTSRQEALESCKTKSLLCVISYCVIDWRQVPLFVIEVSHYLFASLSDVRLRRNFEFPEEDHVFVTMKSEHSSPGPWSKMGLDRRHQNPTEVHLYILTVHCD